MSDEIFSSEDACVRAIAAGELAILPTDTVYGIGANPFSTAAVAKLLAVKGRSEAKPPPILASTSEEIFQLGHWNNPEQLNQARRLAKVFWPGPLTLIIPTKETFGWDTSTVGYTVAVRIPAHDRTRAVLARTGPLAVTSANSTDLPPALNVEEARKYFPEVAHLDGGPSDLGAASTIIDLVHDRVLRVGALDLDLIEEVLA